MPAFQGLKPCGLLVVLVLGASAMPLRAGQVAEAEDEPSQSKIQKRKPTQFVRILRDEYKNPVALQTATAKYVLKDEAGKNRLEVFLESAIHVGDGAYYQGFNQRFPHYDAVLYELVAPPGKEKPEPEESSGNPMRLIQQAMAGGLGFAHQVHQIDYKAANLVHSDLSPGELFEAMKSRGEDGLTMVTDIILHTMRQMNRQLSHTGEVSEEPEAEFSLSMLTDPNGTVKLRRLLAAGFTQSDDLGSTLTRSQRRLLIGDRNQRAMQVFQKQLDSGKRRIAFFWGAGHMADFEKQLLLEYSLQPAGVVWRNAWDLREGSVQRAPLESILEDTLRGGLEEALRELFEPSDKEQKGAHEKTQEKQTEKGTDDGVESGPSGETKSKSTSSIQ